MEQFEFKMNMYRSELEQVMKTIDTDNKTYVHLTVNAGEPWDVTTEIFGEHTPGDRCIITQNNGIFLEYDTADISEDLTLIDIENVDIELITVQEDPVEE